MSGCKPELRFKEFTGDWEENKLGDLAFSISSGKTKKKNDNGKYNVYGSTGIIGCNDFADYDGNYVLVARVGANAGKLNLINEKCGISDNTLIIDNNQEIQTLFLFFYLKYFNLNRLVFGTGQPLITGKQLKKLKINLPKIKEQEKIANFLSKIDEKIVILEYKLELWNSYKKGIMQQLFSQELRFKDKNGDRYSDWDEKILGNISEIKTGKKDLKDAEINGIYPFFVRSANIEKINSYSFDGEAILIPGDGRIGEIFHYVNGKFDYHQRVYKISDFKDTDGKFIYYYLQKNFLRHALMYTVKATVDSLRLPIVKEMKIQLPSLQEQRKIVDFLDNIYSKIEEISSEIEKNKEFKKGLLQKMFC